ncbi:MAG: cellulase family glycosylhydrolase [Alteromonadaceae bacterium]|nr:cellulase family glycosylhydrolase [Alteromonadaceae bacterium]
MEKIKNTQAPRWRRVLAQAVISAALFTTMASVEAVEPLRKVGNQIKAGGKVQSFGGMSLFWHQVPQAAAFYNETTVARLKNETNSKIIRVAIGVDANFNTDKTLLGDWTGTMAAVDRVVNAAVNNDMYVIIDFHSHHADEFEDTAHAFFAEVSAKYGHLDNVIYEIFNEPIWNDWDGAWSGVIKPYAERVISTIRENDPDNLVIVGTRTWSQRVDEASRDQINDINIAYALHFYAGSHFQDLRDKAQEALNNGAALFVTEWGTVDASGSGGVNNDSTWAWIDWLNERGISHANWSASSQPESSAMWNGDGSYTVSGSLVKEVIEKTNGTNPGGDDDIITGPCNFGNMPGIMQAEDFCQAAGIQTEASTDTGGGDNIGYIDDGDWLTYDINMPQAGTVTVNYRVASNVDGGVIKIEEGGGAVSYGTVTVGNTGGWQNWVTVSHQINLPAGNQTIGLAAEQGGWNLNWFEITTVTNPTQDSDNDGVLNNIDQCPDTPAGTAVNSVGCSLPTGDDCDGINPYPNWTTADYAGGPNTHNEAGEIMQYGGNAYSANWYTNSIPGSDNTWSFVRSCSIN